MNLTDANITGANWASATFAGVNATGLVDEHALWPYELAGDDGLEEARWALREAWKRVEQKEAEEEPEDRAA